MPPKTRFERSDIVEAAFSIACERGLDAIKARHVADRLGSSVAPIYDKFATMDDLIGAVVGHVLSLSQALLEEQRGGSVFENIGRASLAFAREYPLLARDLALKPSPWISNREEQDQALVEKMDEDPELAGWSTTERQSLLLQMRAFQMGLMLMTSNGQVPSWAQDIDLVQLLMETGRDLVKARNGRRVRRET